MEKQLDSHLVPIRDYNIFSNQVYYIDPKKGNYYFVNEYFQPIGVSQSYKVLDISRNGTYGSHQKYGAKNGMQAMAVAPVNKNGKVDYSWHTRVQIWMIRMIEVQIGIISLEVQIGIISLKERIG